MFFSGANQFSPLIVGMSALVLSVSCTDGSSPSAPGGSAPAKGNQPPVIKAAKILNDPIPLTGPVAVQVDAEDPEREAVSFQYQWYVNDAPLPKQTSATLPAELLRRGQTVMVEIIPTDGTHKGQAFRTKRVVVGNTSPKVTAVSLTPQTARPGEKIEAQVEANDPDHDRVDLTYKWFRNNAMIKEGDEPFLDTTGLASRDQIVVEVTAHDPAVSGGSMRSDPLVLGNSAPKIVSAPPAPGAPDHFEYPVRAEDPDGDRLTYQLEAAPPGMTISEESGHIAWQIPADQHGTFHVKVVAKDGRGGMASQEFDLTLTVSVPPKPTGA
ncbi:MAG: cadherin repeat domain-containing protein [Nitrospirae bacterium]|nr:cadherin repeat domain-containing protein [Nitrospirota bacterium]